MVASTTLQNHCQWVSPYHRLAFKHLRPLSYQRLGLPTTLTTWISLLYVRLTDPLEFRDVILTSILTLIIYTKHHHEISPRDSWNYTYLTPNSCFSYHNHHFYLKHPIPMPTHHQLTIPCHNHFKHTNFSSYNSYKTCIFT